MADLVAGRVQLMFETIPNSIPTIQSGQLRARRHRGRALQALPDVPTMSEAGVRLCIPRLAGVMAPAGTPQPFIDKLNAAVLKAVATPAVTKRDRAWS
jgi:tripartite-type tricarboxylate transporter receptor subunit TctC